MKRILFFKTSAENIGARRCPWNRGKILAQCCCTRRTDRAAGRASACQSLAFKA